MSRNFQVFLAGKPDLEKIVQSLGWERLDGSASPLALRGRDWEAYLWDPTPMSWEDAPLQATELQAGIAWHVELAVQGRPSQAGLAKVRRALTAVAKAGHGVIADEAGIWRPGRGSRTRWTVPPAPLRAETDWLTMCWWSTEATFRSLDGTTDFLRTVERVIPEALLVRWGDIEPLPSSIEKEGLEGLARYAHDRATKGRSVVAEGRPPFASLWLNNYGRWLGGSWESSLPLRTVEIEAGGSVLRQPGWGRQLSTAFVEISRVLRPFYAEARVEPGVTWRGPTRYRDDAYSPPTNRYGWCGFPRVAPMAMAVGPPYTSSWGARGGSRHDDMLFYSGEVWPDPPPGGVPIATEDLLQEFDPGRGPERSAELPTRKPPVWPFPELVRPVATS